MLSDDLINRLIRYPRAVASRIRIMRLRMCGVRFGRKCWIRRIHVPRNPWDIALDDMVALDDEVVLLTTGTRGAGLTAPWQAHLCQSFHDVRCIPEHKRGGRMHDRAVLLHHRP